MFNLKKNKANTSKQTQQNNRVKDQKEQSRIPCKKSKQQQI